ncbi:thiamine pyrophosphate-binding protein [Candidatus Pacearchaeota archaeon]|nr:thiamine pyrophosphate-binding protein [Candidatus Pacearchaeota archaeon]
MITVSDYVMKYIEQLGVKDIFLLSGGGAMFLVDSAGKSNLNIIPNLHEQASVICAEAYSSYTENIGVVICTTGPGVTNCITGIASAYIDSIPLLVIAGQVKTKDMIEDSNLRQKGIQEINSISIVESITKYSKTVLDARIIRYYLDEAIHYATTGRKGPVFLEIPLDVQNSLINESKLLSGLQIGSPYTVRNELQLQNDGKINYVIKKLFQSKKPVILAGNGVRLSGALSNFKKLIKKLNIPVLLSWKANDFMDENDPLYFGRPGSISSRYANFILQQSDLLISIGNRLDFGTTAFQPNNFAPRAEKIIIDIDPFEINKQPFSSSLIKFNCDAKNFIDSLLEKDLSNLPVHLLWLNTCTKLKEKYPICLSEYYQEKDFVNSYVFIEELSKLLNSDDIIIPSSSGSAAEITSQAIKIKEGQRYLFSPGLGSMGYAIPYAIGVSFASNKEKRIICIEGDGSLQHNIQELQLIKRYNLPIKLFIWNNGEYGSIRNTQNKFFKVQLVACDNSSGVTLPSISKIAIAYDIPIFKISNHNNINLQIKNVLEYNGPVICEVMINPKQLTMPRVQNEILEDGTIISKSMEDLFPFLDRKEFEESMR